MEVDVVALSRLTTIVLGMCVGTVALIAVVGLLRAPESTIKFMLAAVQSGLVIRMTTAIVIVIAIFGLRIIDKISPDAAIATISGIAGYILGSQQAPKPASARADVPRSSDASQSN